MAGLFCTAACRRSSPVTDRVQVDLSRLFGRCEEARSRATVSSTAVVGAEWYETKAAAGARWEEEVASDGTGSETTELEQAERLAWERAEEERRIGEEDAKRAGGQEEPREAEPSKEEAAPTEERATPCRAMRATVKPPASPSVDALVAERERSRSGEDEEQRMREEAARHQERRALEREQWRRKRALRQLYSDHGFQGVNHPRRVGCAAWGAGTTCPLHRAAELAEEGVVADLLQEGALSSQQDSAGRTAAEVARRRNKGGSHEGVLRLLAGASAAPRAGGA